MGSASPPCLGSCHLTSVYQPEERRVRRFSIIHD
jgi:hypothetical protein